MFLSLFEAQKSNCVDKGCNYNGHWLILSSDGSQCFKVSHPGYKKSNIQRTHHNKLNLCFLLMLQLNFVLTLFLFLFNCLFIPIFYPLKLLCSARLWMHWSHVKPFVNAFFKSIYAFRFFFGAALTVLGHRSYRKFIFRPCIFVSGRKWSILTPTFQSMN